MQKQLTMNGETVAYEYRASQRATCLRLMVYPDGTVRVTAPGGLPEREVERFLIQKGAWILSKLAYWKQLAGVHWIRSSKREYRVSRERARALVLERLAHFNAHYELSYARVSIRNQKTRWGSCSIRGNLSFNYKVLFLPPHLVDYLVVHELCHLAVFDHSRAFWNRVSETIPQADACRAQLRNIRSILR